MEQLIVASNNIGKIKEIKALFSNRYHVISMREAGIEMDVEETGATFEENALIKAKAVFERVNAAVLSDDSGLIVDALGGQPGVYSARYSGKTLHADAHNNALLLKNLEGVENRNAKFVSAVVLLKGIDDYLTAVGETQGAILLKADGANGFGYDPLFFSYDLGKSFGIATDTEKNSVSHRARALQLLAGMLDFGQNMKP